MKNYKVVRCFVGSNNYEIEEFEKQLNILADNGYRIVNSFAKEALVIVIMEIDEDISDDTYHITPSGRNFLEEYEEWQMAKDNQ